MLKEVWKDIHIKSFAGQVTAIDVPGFYSIHSRVKEIGLPLLGRPLLLSLVCMITYKN